MKMKIVWLKAADVRLEELSIATSVPLFHNANAGRKACFGAPVGLIGDGAGNVKGIAPKRIFVDLGSQFCWES
jgi:hypothetical protein